MTKPKKSPSIDLTSGVDDEETPTTNPSVDELLITLAGNHDASIALDEPQLPGFQMVDEPEELGETPQAAPVGYSEMINRMAAQNETYTGAVNDYAVGGATYDPKVMGEALSGEIMPPVAPDANQQPAPKARTSGKKSSGSVSAPAKAVVTSTGAEVTYESRIRIMDAWQYNRDLTTAPEWVDRNWVGWGDHDQLRGIDAGPCLRVPDPKDPNAVILCRIGDYLARQEVVLGAGSFVEIEVWEREQFQRLFMKVVEASR